MFMKSMLASFPFSNGLGMSLPLSRVKNLVMIIGTVFALIYDYWIIGTPSFNYLIHSNSGNK